MAISGDAESRACAEIMDALGINEADDGQTAAEAACEAGVVEETAKWKIDLRIINEAITAMEKVTTVEMENGKLLNWIKDAAYELRGCRAEIFECHVDWESMAK